ncbi:hypothetical protein E2C01_025597 [Portunus trituberculatus]|uniref:Uncharacterized protein n=1 Tax=Portunus trituberculatus TaxID=210409 RepID=A0A5B7EG54_PORTR|nr:hypothetical protein [Portunus trituberculatus]
MPYKLGCISPENASHPTPLNSLITSDGFVLSDARQSRCDEAHGNSQRVATARVGQLSPRTGLDACAASLATGTTFGTVDNLPECWCGLLAGAVVSPRRGGDVCAVRVSGGVVRGIGAESAVQCRVVACVPVCAWRAAGSKVLKVLCRAVNCRVPWLSGCIRI